MGIFRLKAKIISQRRIKGDYWHCALSAAPIAAHCSPGQFLNIKVSSASEPLLRRPLSIHGVSGAKVKLFYEVVGQATQILSGKKSGELLDVIGPLGNGFDHRLPQAGKQVPLLVAGGMGVAPLVFLAERLRKSRRLRPKTQNLVLIGAKNKNQILCEKEFRALGYTVKVSTDDGSRGFGGKVTELLENLSSAISFRSSVIYACGPRPMLKTIASFARERGIKAQLSLEEHMACGIGACLGCAVETKSGYRRVCKDGPVFGAEELVW